MCGQVGIIFGKKRRRITEREYLNEVFIRMLLCSEERGPHTSGMAWLRTDSDLRLQNETKIPQSAFKNPQSGDWDLVHRELMTFANPSFDLPPIDRLEAFDPNGRCVYKRVLVAVEASDLIRPVWLYNYKLGHNTERIASGCWYPAK